MLQRLFGKKASPPQDKPALPNEVDASQSDKKATRFSAIIRAASLPIHGAYYAGKSICQGIAFTGRGIYNIGHTTYTFPSRLRRAELGPMLLTTGAIAAFTLQKKVPLTSPVGVAGSVLSIYLAANVAYGVAIPTIAIGSIIALSEHYNPGLVKNFCAQSVDFLRIQLGVATPKQIADIKAATKANAIAAKEAASKLAELKKVKAATPLAPTTAQGSSFAYSIYSKFALGAGLGLNFAGEGLLALGEGTTEAGLAATAEAFDLSEARQKQVRVGAKVASTAIAAIATVTIAKNTGGYLKFIAAPILFSAGSVALDLFSGKKPQSKAQKLITQSELAKVEKEQVEESSKYKKAHAGVALAKGICLEALGSTATNLGLGLIHSHGGMLTSLTSSIAARAFMPEAAASLYGGKASSSLDTLSSYAASLKTRTTNAVNLGNNLIAKFLA
jgi:hypothetical protein